MSVRIHPMTLSGTLADPAVLIDGQAYFRLTYAPEDHNCAPAGHDHEVREAVLPCAVADPAAAAESASRQPAAPRPALRLVRTGTRRLAAVLRGARADRPGVGASTGSGRPPL